MFYQPLSGLAKIHLELVQYLLKCMCLILSIVSSDHQDRKQTSKSYVLYLQSSSEEKDKC